MKKNYLFLVLLLWIGVNSVKAEDPTIIEVKTGQDFIDAFSEENTYTNIILEIQDNIILTDNITITGKTVIIRGPKKENPEELYSISYDDREEKTITLVDATVTVEDLRFEGSVREASDHSYAKAFILDSKTSLTINSCTFEHYHGPGSGGVIQNNGGSLELNNCSFSNNSSYMAVGGIYNDGGTVVATDCKFTNHYCGSSSAGMVLGSESGNIRFTNCIIIQEGDNSFNNKCLFSLGSTNAEFINCQITGGESVMDSGGENGELTLQGCTISKTKYPLTCSNTLLIDRCIFTENKGAILSFDLRNTTQKPTQIIRNSLFVDNYFQKESEEEEEEKEEMDEYPWSLIEYKGGANTTPLTIVNCTFAGNDIQGVDKLFIYTPSNGASFPHFYNTILEATEGNAFGFAENQDYEGAPPTLNDLVFQNCLTNLESLGENDANKDNRVGITNFGFAGERDYSLIAGSPALDAGNNTLYGDELEEDTDLAGDKRLLGASIDIGAYEGIKSLPAPPTYHSFTLALAPGVELYGLSAGEHLVEAGGHLHLQFLPEDRTLGADDVLLLIDGVETEFKDFGANLYFSYILNPIKQNHNVVIALREYTVTLPEVQGITYDVGAGMHRVAYGNSFTFRLTLADEIDPADVHVFANGQEIRANELRSTVLTYTIDRVITAVTVLIKGGSTTSNASLTQGVRVIVESGKLKVENEMGTAVDVTVYSITAQNMVQLRGLRGSKTITLPAGIYIVRAGQTNTKVIIP